MAFSDKIPDVAATFRSLLPEPDRPGRVLATVERIEASQAADPLLGPLRRAVHTLPPDLRDILHGKPLGHPAHPVLVQLPMGSWTSAAVLDMLPGKGKRRAAGLLIALGVATAAPAALTGWTDWADLRKPQMRVGLVHALANSGALALYTTSLWKRLRGRRMAGRAYGLAGLTLVSVGGALGGHLAYRQASGANHAEQVAALADTEWHAIAMLSDLPVGRAVRAEVGDITVMVVREASGTVRVLADRCSHMAGPLSEGELENGCVRCPWHGSTFRLDDGWNVQGPATAPQPVFETRVIDGRVEARFPEHARKNG
ncbi:Rieske 2Fe-2S domain-containing protein [Streptomyces avicenniae]|uniref:Rieske 2Fe-2S domain-containing protein n=1 Tax=Streptomyces avicenniae TaxID=500153 RepID=UPI00069B49E2|nr:Rieske 2Fe-2S domain-containing protein [Streptomyces avicenniae]